MDEHAEIDLPIDSDASAHLARREARLLAESLGWSSTRIAELETAVSEVATNTWVHAGGGHIELWVEDGPDGAVVHVAAHDRGPGITDLEAALRDGASTAGTLGLGLSACTRLMDDVTIETEPGVGTTIWMSKAERRPSTPSRPRAGLSLVEFVEGPNAIFGNLDWARASRPEPGGTVCGDAALVKPTRRGEIIAVVDGAGHGAGAAAAAADALVVVARHAEESPVAILERCHEALAHTVGAAVTVLKIDALSNTLTWAGIGNVDAAIWSATSPRPRAGLVPRSGTLGYQMPPPREVTIEVLPDDLIVMWTDGIRSAAATEIDVSATPRDLVAQMLADGARPSDDALVLAARYLGGTLQ